MTDTDTGTNRADATSKSVAVKGHSYTPLLTSLLKPAAETLGAELATQIKAGLENWKLRRRTKNLKGHLSKAESLLGRDLSKASVSREGEPEPLPPGEQAEMLSLWLERAQDVDADDGPLSELWQELLVKIHLGLVRDKLLVETLQTLGTEKASLLLRFRGKPIFKASSALDYFLLKDMKRREIVEISWLRTLGSWFGALLFFVGHFYLALIVTAFPRAFEQIESLSGLWGEMPARSPVTAAVSVVMITFLLWYTGFTFRKRILYWRLTWLGKELVRPVRRSEQRFSEKDDGSTGSGGLV